jgi:putative membrane protein
MPELSAFQLRRRKMRVVKLSLAFAFAVKVRPVPRRPRFLLNCAQHYLRGEDGVDFPDFEHVLPAAFVRASNLEHSAGTSRRASVPPSMLNGREPAPSAGSARTADGSPERVTDATKRVRVKRSNPTLRERAPLLPRDATTISFDEVSIPLPLV